MKQIITLICTAILLIVGYSCSQQTYAKQLKAEEQLIQDYIRREHINVLHSFPAEDAWQSNDYVALDKGLYYHLEKAGESGDSIQAGNLAIIRYKSYTLSLPTDSVIMWSTTDSANPVTFVWGTSDKACEGWLTALALMKRQYSECKIIVPSKIGFSSQAPYLGWSVSDDESSVTPRLYHLQLRFQK
ncbi:MAG: DUF4827 domain-containing protein [Paludibacter sp.]|nr:DUF4827 domain-containing protein [Paludibacter sp.]